MVSRRAGSAGRLPRLPTCSSCYRRSGSCPRFAAAVAYAPLYQHHRPGGWADRLSEGWSAGASSSRDQRRDRKILDRRRCLPHASRRDQPADQEVRHHQRQARRPQPLPGTGAGTGHRRQRAPPNRSREIRAPAGGGTYLHQAAMANFIPGGQANSARSRFTGAAAQTSWSNNAGIHHATGWSLLDGSRTIRTQ